MIAISVTYQKSKKELIFYYLAALSIQSGKITKKEVKMKKKKFKMTRRQVLKAGMIGGAGLMLPWKFRLCLGRAFLVPLMAMASMGRFIR